MPKLNVVNRTEEFARNDALELHQTNAADKDNTELYELRKKIFFEAVAFQKRIEEMCLADGFYPDGAHIDINRVDDTGDRYGFVLTVESGCRASGTES
jgi:hypothetical protein